MHAAKGTNPGILQLELAHELILKACNWSNANGAMQLEISDDEVVDTLQLELTN